MSSLSLENLLAAQVLKLQKLNTATKLIKTRTDIKDELLELDEELYSLLNAVQDCKNDLETIKSDHMEYLEMTKVLKIYSQQIQHMEKNIPQQIEKYVQSDTLVKAEKETNDQIKSEFCTLNSLNRNQNHISNGVNNCEKTLFNGQEISQISLLTREEFQKIPKYIIGRNTFETLNCFISNINMIIRNKYSLVALGQLGARKKGELDLYLQYKKQQAGLGREEEHTCFFIAEDYERYVKAKIDKTKLNFISALRHCKRLREIRTSKTVHYALIS